MIEASLETGSQTEYSLNGNEQKIITGFESSYTRLKMNSCEEERRKRKIKHEEKKCYFNSRTLPV